MRKCAFSALGIAAIGAFFSLMVAPALADSIKTGEAAADRVKSEGYSLISKAEAVPGAWDVWASKDGIAYEVKIDAGSGAVVKAVPVDDND